MSRFHKMEILEDRYVERRLRDAGGCGEQYGGGATGLCLGCHACEPNFPRWAVHYLLELVDEGDI